MSLYTLMSYYSKKTYKGDCTEFCFNFFLGTILFNLFLQFSYDKAFFRIFEFPLTDNNISLQISSQINVLWEL